MIVLLGLISTSYVQTKIVSKLAQNFKKITEQEISFENLKLRWNGKLDFNNFYLEDHHKDTLLYIKTLKTSLLDFKHINENNFDISEFKAEGVFLNLKKYRGESKHSLRILFDKLKKDSIANKKVLFKIKKLVLEKVTFIYEDQINTESQPVHLDSLFIEANELKFENNGLEVALEKFEGKIHKSRVKPFKIATLLNYEPGELNLKDLNLTSGNNNLNGSLELLGVNKSFKDFKSRGIVRIEVLNSNWNLSTLFPESKNLESIPAINASFITQGELSALEFSKLEISNSFLDFQGRLKGINILDPNDLSMELSIDSLLIKTQELQPITFISSKIKKQLKQVEYINFRGTSLISNHSIDFNLNSKNSWGNFSMIGDLGNGIFHKIKSVKTFSVNADFVDLELSRWISKKSVFRLGGSPFSKR